MSVLDRYHPAQKPTAQASLADTAATALSSFTTAPGLGEGTMLDGDADSTFGLGTNVQVPTGPEDEGSDAPTAGVHAPYAFADGVPQSSPDCTENRIG